VPFWRTHWLYRRLGPRYPKAFYLLLVGVGLGVAAGSTLLVDTYYGLTTRETLKIAGIAVVITLVGLTKSYRRAAPRITPLREWIEGKRDPESTLEAWDAAVNLPMRVMRYDAPLPILFVSVVAAAAFTATLNVPWTAFFPLLAGALVTGAYALILQYFGIEIGLRPVVEDINTHMPANFGFTPTGLPLRTKLLAILPAMNVITGLVVGGLTSDHTGSAGLGLIVLVSTGVAFTIALELALLLTDSVLRPVGALRTGMARVAEGDYGTRVDVTTSDELGELSDRFNRMVEGLAERERLRDAFGTYLDRDVAAQILDEGGSADGVEVDASILFCDVRSFTTFASETDARAVVSELNDLFEILVPLVSKHGGHVDKFVGDGLLAVFGAPQQFADHADRAVAAAREMVTAVAAAGGQLQVGVGVNTGSVIAGSIGGGGRLNFSVIGDPVNVAARVEAATRETGDDILITDATCSRLTRDVPLQPRGEVELKGKSEPLVLWAIGGNDRAALRPQQAAEQAGA
jgi:class 3 adenylate cyclase